LIEIKNLTKYYGSKIALDNLSFSVKQGEVLGFLGPNGAGKSTTMKIITGYLSPTEGTVTVDGLDVYDDSLEVRRRIGYLPEHPPLYLDMTVKDYLEFAAKIKGVESKKVRSCVENTVEKCGLKKYYRSYCNSLSKGYRQRVGIAQAIVHDPKILILDEPTIGLDPIQIVEIRNLIKSFGGDHTVILSTHILSEVDMTCERVIIINEGTVVAEDLAINLKEDSTKNRDLIVKFRGTSSRIISEIKKFKEVQKVETDSSSDDISLLTITVKPGKDLRPEIAKLVINENLELFEIRYQSKSLEQIFVNLTMN
jgi:ABC-2 type transport system ATP-binding protein